MANEIQEKKKQLIDKVMRERPEVLSAKRFTGVIVLIWLATRMFQLATEYYCVMLDMVEFSVLNTIVLLVTVLFVWTIYQGVKTLAFLPILGGIFMIIQTFKNGLYSLLFADVMLPVKLYAGAFILAAYAQVVLLVFLVANSKSNVYFDAMKDVAKRLGIDGDSQRLR